MYFPLGAISAFGRGASQALTEDVPKIYDLMGAAALGKAFQLQPGPIDQRNIQGPQPPMPGQPSVPAQQPLPPPPDMPQRTMSPSGGGPSVGIYGQSQFNPMDAQSGGGMPPGPPPMMPPQGMPTMGAGGVQPMPAAGGAPPPGPVPQQAPPGGPSPSAPPGGTNQGMPQLDLQTLAQRIQQTSPGLPPQAMIAALTRAVPLLNVQGRQELAQLRMQMQQQGLELKREGLDARRDALDSRERLGLRRLDIQEEAEHGRKDRFGQREERLTSQGDRRLDQGEERLNLIRKTYEERLRTAAERNSQSQDNATEIANAIKRGEQPPTLQGLYRQGAAVRTALAKDGFNLAKAQQEWGAAQKQIQSLNGPQMTRYAGLANSVVNTIDEVKSLSEEMANSGIPLLNRAKLQTYIQTQGNSPNGQLAARYLAGINTLKEEFANLAQGGYAPTESAWALANQQINGDYGVKQLGASLDEVQRLIRYRLQGIPNFSTLGPAAPGNRYFPQQQGGGGGEGPPANMPRPQGQPIKVGSPAEANRLAPGTLYVTPDGKEFVR